MNTTPINITEINNLPTTLPPSDDGIFKTMLTKPEATAALESAVAAFLGRPVKKVSLRNNDAPAMNNDGKHERYDINCVVDGEDGDQCDVEMQATSMEGDNAENDHRNVKWRSVYYLSHLHSNQRGQGLTYSGLAKSYQVMLCNYKVFNHNTRLAEWFTLRNPDGYELCDAVTAIFIDLTKSKELVKKPVSELTDIEAWVVFLALADKPKYNKVVGEIVNRMEGIAVANAVLQNISQDKDVRAYYLSRLKWELDREHDMAVAKNEGVEEGVKKARQEYEPVIEEQQSVINEQKAAINEKDAALTNKNTALAQKDAENAALKAELEKLKAQLEKAKAT